jgi:hypothetical protein
MATRSLPYNKDRHALTNGGLATLYNVLNHVMPGSAIIVPVPHFQPTLVVHRRNKKRHTKFYVHPDQDEGSRAVPEDQVVYVNEITWEVLYVATEQDIENGVESPTF